MEYCGDKKGVGHAVSYKLRVESNQGRGDDTALNTICLTCSGGDEVCSKLGFWGKWYNETDITCSGGFNEFKFLFEDKQWSWDDTAANNIQLRCNNSGKWAKTMASQNNTGWGAWWGGNPNGGSNNPRRACPVGQIICGLQTRVQKKLGSDTDDTALNGVIFDCCSKSGTTDNQKGDNTQPDAEPDVEPVGYLNGDSNSLYDMLKSSQTTATRVTHIMGLTGGILKDYADGKMEFDTVRIKPVQKGYEVGEMFQVNGKKDAKKLFKVKALKIAENIGDALGAVCTFAAPLFIIGDMIWGDTMDQYHWEIMAKLEDLEVKIDGISDKIEKQTDVLDNIIQKDSFRNSYAHLNSIGQKFGTLTKNDDKGAKVYLKDKFADTSTSLHQLDSKVQDYFRSLQNVNFGCCTDLHKIRAWLSGMMINALFGTALGCELRMEADGDTLKNGRFNPEKDCLMTTERNAIISINNKMVEILEQVRILESTHQAPSS